MRRLLNGIALQRKYAWYTQLLFPLLFVCFLLSSSGCTFITSALPPTPAPMPTLARLPTVTPTPITPTPTITPIPIPKTPTATPEPVESRVIAGANVRTGPSTEYDVVETITSGHIVLIYGKHGEWYLVETPTNIRGWMAGELLTITQEEDAIIPLIEP